MKKVLFILVAAIITMSASAQTKRALVIGISNYPNIGANSWEAIHGANDTELIVPVLQKQGFKTTKICDKAATAKRIRKELNVLATSCNPGDIVYLHFSCHGQPFEDMNGDEEDGWDESIVPYDAQKYFVKGMYEGQNHISDDELHSYYLKIRKKIGEKGFLCVVDDACYAGGSSRGGDETDEDEEVFVRGSNTGFSPNGKTFLPRPNRRRVFPIPQESGLADITILEACRHYQSNQEIKQSKNYYGPLSYSISQVLKKDKLTNNLSWVKNVEKLFNEITKNRFYGRQNMVYETTLK